MRRLARAALCAALVAALAADAAQAASGGISTVAGTGGAGFGGDDGPATSAQLNLPRAVATLPKGGFLIADRVNDRVRRVSPGGMITTVAGNGTAGFSGDGEAATDAQIDFIHAATPAADGGFLVSDTRNQRVRYVSPAGIITTAAGSGPFGCFCSGGFSGDGGQATGARLNNPHGLALDADGSYLVADTDNNRARRVSPGGVITTVAGSGPTGSTNGGFAGDGGPATGARLDRPFDVAPTADGGFLIADTGNQVVRRVAPDAMITTVAGQPGEDGFAGDVGPATEAKLSSPHAVAVTPDGGFLIADKNNQRVRRVAPDGTITTVAGSGPTGDTNGGYAGDGGTATEALLNRPKGLAATAAGDFLVADESNHRIRFVDADLVPPQPPQPEPEPAGPPQQEPEPPPALAVSIDDQRLRAHRGERVKLRYSSTIEAAVELTVRGGGRPVAHRRAAATSGPNKLTLGRRLTRRKLEPGRYRLVLSAESADGQRAGDRARLKVLGGKR